MSDSDSMDTGFLSKLTEVVRKNLNNEQFGVSTLVKEIGMSRTYIHRQLKHHLGQNISQFIRSERLKKAMELILETELNAYEIAFRVGISSPAYFSWCFHEYYRFPPGEARKRHFSAGKEEEKSTHTKVSEPDTKVANKAESPNSLKPSKNVL